MIDQFWSSSNTQGKYPNPFVVNPFPGAGQFLLQKSDFVRVRNITLGYDLNPLFHKKWFNTFRVYVDASNPMITTLLAYTLYDFYGPTAIVTDPAITLDPNTNFQPERPTKAWLLNFIKSTARDAADNLPVSYSSQNYGRFTKGTALMVLLKLAMHEQDWTEAAQISKEIMDLKLYSLQTSYPSIFAGENALNDFILDERFRELFMEGHRREDLIRHGKYLSEAFRKIPCNKRTSTWKLLQKKRSIIPNGVIIWRLIILHIIYITLSTKLLTRRGG